MPSERRRLLAPPEIDEALRLMPHWTARDGRLERTYDFPDFSRAFAWMTAVALKANQLDHHPDWSHSWRTVRVAWTTHSAGGVTPLDVELASYCDETARPLGACPA